MTDAKQFLSVFGELLHFLLFSAIFSMKNAIITITYIYFSALTLAVSLGFKQLGGLGFKQLPGATANVNA